MTSDLADQSSTGSQAVGDRAESKASAQDGDSAWPLGFELYPGDEVGLRFSADAIADLHTLVSRSKLDTFAFINVVAVMTKVGVVVRTPTLWRAWQ